MKEPPSQTFATCSGPLRDSRRIHRLPRMAAHLQRPNAAGAADAPPALLQQARVDRQLRHAGDAAGGDARRRLGKRDGPTARRRLDRAGSERPLLRPLLADASSYTGRTPRALQHQAAEVHEGDGRPRRQPLRGDVQPAERLVEHRARQRRAQSAPTRVARDERRGPELPVHARPRRACQPAPAPRGARGLRDPASHAVRVQPARGGRGAHARPGRDRQREELPDQLPRSRTRRSTTR